LAKALTLKPHAKRSGGLKGAIRFGAFFFVTAIMFPVFILTFPLRWLVRIESAQSMSHPD
jgi:hypothetical protein